MKRLTWVLGVLLMVALTASTGLAAYHHQGENDSDNFLAVYPDKAGTKLDHCALCHTGGEYEKKPGVWVSLGSCQWCHYSYGYDGSGNILDTMNQYGKDYHYNGRDQDALRAIENIDSDGDTYLNIDEIQAIRYPGNAGDDPSMVPAPSRVFSKTELEAMPQHTQFLLLNTSRSGDFYAQYTGVILSDLLAHAGILPNATGVTVFAPDGWSNYHPLAPDPDPELYHVNGIYPESVYYYDPEADVGLNPDIGWCDYSAPSCAGRNHLDPIVVPGGLRMILAHKREGADLIPGVLNPDNKLDGEGPFRVVPPQKDPGPPDQSSRSPYQDVIWPYDYDWDHNAGSASRTATIIRVEPLPPGTTDIDVLEAGWNYVDEEKIVIYGAISGGRPTLDIKANGRDENITISAGNPVSLSISVFPGLMAGFNADWWVAASTPQFFSLVFPVGWVPGLLPMGQLPLFKVWPFEVFNGPLPAGDYAFHFLLDGNPDGNLGPGLLDTVQVHVE